MLSRLGPSVLASLAVVLLTVAWPKGVAAEERANPAQAAPAPAIHVIDFEGEIGPLLLSYVRRHVHAAEAAGATTIVLRIESPGGRVHDSSEIADLLMAVPSTIHTVAWIPRYAYSGACMVALACREIVMGPNARLGDCQPILMGPEGFVKAGEKIESPLRAMFRGFAEAHGWSEALCEAFVSEDVEVLEVHVPGDGRRFFVRRSHWDVDQTTLVRGTDLPRMDLRAGAVVVPKGELLTVTTQQARDLGFIRPKGIGVPPPTDEAVLEERMRRDGASWTVHEPDFQEKAAAFLFDLAGILAAVVAVSALLVLMRGSFGMTGFVGLGAAALLLLIQLTADQDAGFGIFLVLLGIVLVALEIFVIPGFGVAGILGMVSLGAGFFFMTFGATPGDFGTTITGEDAKGFAVQFVGGVLAMVIAFLVLSRFVPTVGPARRMVLEAPEPTGAAPFVSEDLPALGTRLVAASDLRPAGSARDGDRLLDVVAEGPYIEAGSSVRVIAIEGARILVRLEEQHG